MERDLIDYLEILYSGVRKGEGCSLELGAKTIQLTCVLWIQYQKS